MGFRDRGYSDGYGARRIFSAEQFFSWALPLFTVPRWVPGLAGIRVRVHILYILIAGSEFLSALGKDSVGFHFIAAMMATLFLLVLLHEFGHCLACRKVGGSADDVLMWPLGGLASCAPPHRWKAALVTTAGGPLVNVAFVPVLGAALLAAGASWRLLLFNPIRPGVYGDDFLWIAEWHVWLWSAYYMNLVLLLFNLVVPMYPMDGARIAQELLWSRIGYKRSLLIAANVGLVAAIVLGAYGLWTWTSNSRLFFLALFGASTCYGERVRAKSMEEESEGFYDTDKGYGAFDEPKKPKGPTWAQRRAEKTARKAESREREAQASVDAILDKIRDKGIASLSARERSLLSEATERRRGQGSKNR